MKARGIRRRSGRACGVAVRPGGVAGSARRRPRERSRHNATVRRRAREARGTARRTSPRSPRSGRHSRGTCACCISECRAERSAFPTSARSPRRPPGRWRSDACLIGANALLLEGFRPDSGFRPGTVEAPGRRTESGGQAEAAEGVAALVAQVGRGSVIVVPAHVTVDVRAGVDGQEAHAACFLNRCLATSRAIGRAEVGLRGFAGNRGPAG